MTGPSFPRAAGQMRIAIASFGLTAMLILATVQGSGVIA